MKKLFLAIALFALAAVCPLQAQNSQVGVRTNGILVGIGTNLFVANVELLGQVVVKRVNGVASALVVTNGLDVYGSLIGSGEIAGWSFRRTQGSSSTTNTIAIWDGNNRATNYPGLSADVLQYLLGLTNNINAKFFQLTTNWTELGVARTNGFAVGLTLSNTTLSGPLVSQAPVVINNLLTAAQIVPLYDGVGEPTSYAAPIGYVDGAVTAFVQNLSELAALPTSGKARMAYVFNDTGTDGAAGWWLFDPTSTAATADNIIFPDSIPALYPGRWFKQ